MSVDWSSFSEHQGALEARRLRMERDALAEAFAAALTMLESFRPLLAFTGEHAKEMTDGLNQLVARGRALAKSATTERPSIHTEIQT